MGEDGVCEGEDYRGVLVSVPDSNQPQQTVFRYERSGNETTASPNLELLDPWCLGARPQVIH